MLPAQIPAAAPEVVALGSALNDFLKAIKSGGNVLAAAQAAEGDLLAAIASIGNIGSDIKHIHNQVYLGWAVGQVYEPDQSPAPVAPAP